MLLAILAMGTARLYAAEAYAVAAWDSQGANRRFQLTFYYDNNRSQHDATAGEIVFSMNTGSNEPEWTQDRYAYNTMDVKDVIFDSTFANYRPTTTSHWFDHMYGLENFIGTQYLNTSQVTNMSYMFFCTTLNNIDASWLNVSNVTDMSYMFAGNGRIQTLNLSGWNTSKVTNMSYMFNGCSLSSLNLTLNTSSVTDMSYMFYLCHNLTSLTFGGNWSTANVVNMKWMFTGCDNLTTLNLNGWNVAKVRDMSCMFWECEKLATLSVSNWNTSSVTNMSGMFEDCEALTSLNLSGSNWNTANVTNMSSMFEGCKLLQTITWGNNWNTGKVEKIDDMFRDCENLTQSSLSNAANWYIGNVTDLSGMFANCKKLSSLNLSSWNTSKVTTMSDLFSGCTSLTSLGGLASLNTGNVTAMVNMFNGCTALQGVSDLTSWNTSKVTTMSGMFQGCNSITSLNLSGWNNQELTKVVNMFNGCSNLANINLSGWTNPKLTTIAGLFRDDLRLETINMSQFDLSNVTDMSYAFLGCYLLKNLDMTGWNTSNVTSMESLFEDCRWLKNLDLSSWNTSSVTSMASMFRGCWALESVDLSSWNTSNVTTMRWTFLNCRALTVLDLTGWETSNVTDMLSMFAGSGLTTIYVGDGWSTSSVSIGSNMFSGCNRIVGGLGTEYNGGHTGSGYAHIDAPDNPGYLSSIPYVVYADGTLTFYCDGNRDAHAEEIVYGLPTGNDHPGWLSTHSANVTKVVIDPSFANTRPISTAVWFAEMQNLTEIIGLEYLNTDQVTSMSYMFHGCKLLTDLNLNNFNTSKVSEMTQMFADCQNLLHLGLSSFDTSSLRQTSEMFAGCTKLTTICVDDGWNLASNVVSTNMFLNCPALVGGIGTTYDSTHTDGSYAHIDTKDNPGYLCDQSQLDAYVVLDTSTGTLTFHNDSRRGAYGDNTFDLNQDDENPGWYANRKAVQHVVFDYTFNTAHPTSAFSWFRGMSNLTDISGIENLFTDNITTMESMFFSCSKLTTLDLSGWNTSQVVNMENMFGGCSALTTIYVGAGWSTSNVTSSLDMFEGCTSLVGGNGTTYDENHTDKEYACLYGGTSVPSYLTNNLPKEAYAIYGNGTLTFCYDGIKALREGDVEVYDLNVGDENPGWLTHNADITAVMFDPAFANARPTSTHSWFDSMSQLTGFTGLQYLFTDEVNDMGSMFNACTGLTTLDLGSFNTANVENMSAMFGGCSALTTIYAGSGWTTASVTESDGMFVGCTQLAGAAGTQFNPDNTSADYAVVDGVGDNAGYLSYLPYATITDVYSANGVLKYLRFFYDGKHAQHALTAPVYRLNTGSQEPEWQARAGEFSAVTFDSSFRNVRPTSTYHWFYGMNQITSITVSNLNVSEVTNMSGMFEGCSNLQSFIPKDWNTSKVTDMSRMFNGCAALTVLELSAFSTANVTNMSGMFQGCSALTTLSLNTFSTASVTNMSNMFQDCTALTTISVGEGWSTSNVTSSASMFLGCNDLEGSNGTSYNASYTDKSRARVDGGSSSPGYLSDLLVAPYVAYDVSTATMTFYNDSWRSTHTQTYSIDPNFPEWRSLNPVHVVFDPTFDTVRPTSTHMWFDNFRNLEDITGLEYLHTDNVTLMTQMFSDCEKLTSLDVSHFNTSQVTNMRYMFQNCKALTTLDLGGWDTHNVTNMDFMFYGCDNLAEIYVDDLWNTDNVTTSGSMFYNCKKIIGGYGTSYNGSHINKEYARIDQGYNAPGYLRYSYKAYALFREAESSLTIYYDNQYHYWENEGTVYYIDESGATAPGWSERRTDIAHVTINKVSPQLTSIHMWFADMPNLEDVTCIEDQYEVKVFNVTDMSYMFYNCPKLKSFDMSGFDTSKATNMSHMFAGCSTLTSLDLSNFVTEQVTDMSGMFQGCSNLKTIYVRCGWSTANVLGTTSTDMFDGCTRLEGEGGTKYSPSHTDKEYARVDAPAAGQPGYLSSSAEAYAWFDEAESTLVFVCDDQRKTREIETFSLPTEEWETPMWSQYSTGTTTITHVVFDPSFDKARPTSTYMWFSQLENLEEIVGLEHLHTDSVRFMGYMFYSCSKLESLDLSHFNTGMVTAMDYMFHGCSSLKDLNVSSWNTKNVKNMYNMFGYCRSLEFMDLSAWNTQKLETTTDMFTNCTSLEEVDLSNWNGGYSFGQMFQGCSELTTIYATNDWYTDGTTYSVFQGCNKLVGGAGTAYTSPSTDGAVYAKLDGGSSNPGFFTDPAQREAYACYSAADNTLTFYNDAKSTVRQQEPGITVYTGFLNVIDTYPGWHEYRDSIEHVVFTQSFATARPMSLNYWFSQMKRLTDVSGLQFLNTSEVTSMKSMFNDCQLLTSLDVSGFNTANVFNMGYMFKGCKQLATLDVSGFNTANVKYLPSMFYDCNTLTTIDVSGFDTHNVENMETMFYGCKNLETLDVSGFNTAKVTNMGSMFCFCEKLATIDVSGFDTQNVTKMTGMFQNCKVLTSIDVGGFNTAKVTNMKSMFYGCSQLENLDVSGFITTRVTDISAMFYGCYKLKGLDVSGWDTGNVTLMPQVFNYCYDLATLDVSGWNTGKVTNMSQMFYHCRNLATLDLSRWDTGKVTNMSYMFSDCSSLATLDLSGFNTASVTNMDGVFSSSTNLTSLDFSGWDTGKATSMNYMFKACTNLETLDLSDWNTSQVTKMSQMFYTCGKLTTIFVGSGWNTDAVTTENSVKMFLGCTKLKGGNGTTYVNSNTDKTYAHVDVEGNPGYFTYKANFQVGDVNKDGAITIADVTALVNIILGKTADFDQRLADVNGDKSVTIADVTALVNIILGK